MSRRPRPRRPWVSKYVRSGARRASSCRRGPPGKAISRCRRARAWRVAAPMCCSCPIGRRAARRPTPLCPWGCGVRSAARKAGHEGRGLLPQATGPGPGRGLAVAGRVAVGLGRRGMVGYVAPPGAALGTAQPGRGVHGGRGGAVCPAHRHLGAAGRRCRAHGCRWHACLAGARLAAGRHAPAACASRRARGHAGRTAARRRDYRRPEGRHGACHRPRARLGRQGATTGWRGRSPAGSLRTERRRVRPVEAAWGLRDAGQDWLRTWADMASADGAVLRRQP